MTPDADARSAARRIVEEVLADHAKAAETSADSSAPVSAASKARAAAELPDTTAKLLARRIVDEVLSTNTDAPTRGTDPHESPEIAAGSTPLPAAGGPPSAPASEPVIEDSASRRAARRIVEEVLADHASRATADASEPDVPAVEAPEPDAGELDSSAPAAPGSQASAQDVPELVVDEAPVTPLTEPVDDPDELPAGPPPIPAAVKAAAEAADATQEEHDAEPPDRGPLADTLFGGNAKADNGAEVDEARPAVMKVEPKHAQEHAVEEPAADTTPDSMAKRIVAEVMAAQAIAPAIEEAPGDPAEHNTDDEAAPAEAGPEPVDPEAAAPEVGALDEAEPDTAESDMQAVEDVQPEASKPEDVDQDDHEASPPVVSDQQWTDEDWPSSEANWDTDRPIDSPDEPVDDTAVIVGADAVDDTDAIPNTTVRNETPEIDDLEHVGAGAPADDNDGVDAYVGDPTVAYDLPPVDDLAVADDRWDLADDVRYEARYDAQYADPYDARYADPHDAPDDEYVDEAAPLPGATDNMVTPVRPRRRAGRWLIPTLVGAVGLALLLPLAVRAVLDLVSLS